MSRVLVIGGTLFIGRALVRRLLAREDEVTILHRGRRHPFAKQVAEIHCDRNDIEAVKRGLAGRRFDLVFDNVYDWQRGTAAEQVEAAARTLASGLRRYVFMSSVGAYREGQQLSEDAALVPASHPEAYARNKADTERMLFRMHAEQGFPAVTLRPPYVFGPENPFYREAFFWDRILAGRPVVVPGDGSRRMQFISAEDLARAAIRAADTEAACGRAYNVANQPPLTQTELVEALAKAAGKTVRLVYLARERIAALGGRLFEPPLYFGQYFDMPAITQQTSRARRELGFEPTPLEHGWAESFHWYQQQPERPPADFTFDEKMLAAAE